MPSARTAEITTGETPPGLGRCTIAGVFGSLWASTHSFSHPNASKRVAQFPAGPPETDVAVILNISFETKGTAATPFNLGRRGTHEMGYWQDPHHIMNPLSLSVIEAM
jgi:hypothetical protein